MKTTIATGIYSPKKATYEVVVAQATSERTSVSEKGTAMYVFNCDIVLA